MQWYVLRSKPNKEFPLYKQVLAREIDCFFPRVKVNPVNPRSAKVRPYFSSYLFVKTDLDLVGINTFKWMPYAQGLVAFDGSPAIVPDPIINQLKIMVHEINEKGGLKSSSFSTGERIRVLTGPFEGYEGIFDMHLSGKDRARVLLQLLNSRPLSVELDIEQITKKNKR